MSESNFRLYSFVAGLYLSDLQKGLQTAHVVGELFADTEMLGRTRDALVAWAAEDKTIIICSAGNHQGVVDCWAELERLSNILGLPSAIFHEDKQSMNGMATACGVVVPQCYWDVEPVFSSSSPKEIAWYKYEDCSDPATPVNELYDIASPQGEFIQLIKSFRLA